MEDDYKRESQKGVTAKEDESTESLVSSILKSLRGGWIGMVFAMVLFSAWMYYYLRMEHISRTVLFLGGIASFIIGLVCEYCCKRLKQTLMFMGVVVLVLLSILLVKMIFKG